MRPPVATWSSTSGTAVTNLGLAATAVVLSATHVAASDAAGADEVSPIAVAPSWTTVAAAAVRSASAAASSRS